MNKVEVLDKGHVSLVDYMGDDLTVVKAARVSYAAGLKGDSRDKKLLRYLFEHGHMSPFEHVIFSFDIKCPLFVARQWMRHRTWSYNEISRRYTNEEIEFYYPKEWRKQDTKDKQNSTFDNFIGSYFRDDLLDHTANSLNLYESMLEDGVAREMARMVLPQNLYTRFIGTVDLRNLMGFLEQRLDEHAQWEIRQYAQAILNLIEPIVPWTVEVYKEKWNKKTSS